MPRPFGTTFESLKSPTGPVVESVHESPYRRLAELVDSGEGHLISLRAPRAGYGKTMLLARLREKRKSSMSMIPIHLSDGRLIEGERILEEILTQLSEAVPGSAGLTKLDLHARSLFAHGLIPLVYSGEVPSQDKEGALDSLRERPTEAFDFHNDGATIAQWTKSQFEALLPRLSSVLGKASGASTRDTSYWITQLFQFATRHSNELSRTGDLMDAVFGKGRRFHSGAGFLGGVGSFLNLVTLVEPFVLVLDEVDGLAGDCDSALRASSSIISLWESVPRMSVIISVNDDVWESAFVPRLPLGLRDRLEDVVIRLAPLTPEEARALVVVRLGDESRKVLPHLNFDAAALYPRGVLKSARDAWGRGDSGEECVATEGEEAPLVNDTLASDFSAPETSGSPPQEAIEAPVVEAAPQSKINYPPLVVRRVSIPRSFDVQRIRKVALDLPAPCVAPVQGAAFEAAPPQESAVQASPFESAPVQVFAPVTNPFQVFDQSVPESQAMVSPARSIQPSPFEVAEPPATAPEIVPAQMASPFEVPPQSQEREGAQMSPSIFSSDTAQVEPVASPPPLEQAPSPFSAPVNQAPPSPFEANLAPQPVPPQSEAPKADVDAIDELLRQFREHRES